MVKKLNYRNITNGREGIGQGGGSFFASPLQYKSNSMKIYGLLFMTAMIFFCKDAAKQKMIEQKYPDRTVTDNPAIIGIWNVYSSSGNGRMIIYNMAPKIEFRNNGTGVSGVPLTLRADFRWTLNNTY